MSEGLLLRRLRRAHDGEHAGAAEAGRLAAEQHLCLGRGHAAQVARRRPCFGGVACDQQAMAGSGNLPLRGLEQRVGDSLRIGTAGSLALRIDQRGKGGRILFRLAEYGSQQFRDELQRCFIIIVKNEPDRLGVVENVVHEKPLDAVFGCSIVG
jgi:hypothetical protein